jgi:hypothetical protein
VALLIAVALGLGTVLVLFGMTRDDDGAGGSSVTPLTPRQASALADALHRNHEAQGASFRLVSQDSASGTTVTLEGIVDWNRTHGRATVHGYADADGPVTEIAWASDAVAELRPAQDGLLAARSEPPGTFFLRPVATPHDPLDRLIAIVSSLATRQPENAQLIVQNPGAGFLRTDRLRDTDVEVLRYSERSTFWIDIERGVLLRFEGRDSSGRSPVIVDLFDIGPREVGLPVVSTLPLRPPSTETPSG